MAHTGEFQRAALDSYLRLMAEQPGLFTDREARPIVRDPKALLAYAAKHDVVLGVAAETPLVYFIVDLVESQLPGGGVRRHPYLRVVSRAQLGGGVNVVVLATVTSDSPGRLERIVFVEQERHAVAAREIELPRGFGEPGLSGETNALRELEEETGYIGTEAHFLGATHTDSGLTDGIASFYHIPVVSHATARPEVEEAIHAIRLFTRDEAWEAVRTGVILDGFTVQALGLYERSEFLGTR